ncbi:hypothetical protein [Nonomuraea sp. bgisy101]|uniref:hypothetical protein n=1 Tax=Nonomuraea sp. bgisy101 TaxID=3413784 RepID=UPI003D75D667
MTIVSEKPLTLEELRDRLTRRAAAIAVLSPDASPGLLHSNHVLLSGLIGEIAKLSGPHFAEQTNPVTHAAFSASLVLYAVPADRIARGMLLSALQQLAQTAQAALASPAADDSVERVLAAVALCVTEFSGNRETQLLAGIIAARNPELSTASAVDLAIHDAFDPRVKAAGDERAALLKQARDAAMAAEYGEQVTA